MKYTNPGPTTLQPTLLYVEAVLINHVSQMSCYWISSICIRVMLKMGLHREASKLANISAFDGEMRKRMWNLTIQIDLMFSFQMGLPSMIHGVESYTALPRNCSTKTRLRTALSFRRRGLTAGIHSSPTYFGRAL